jgi:hypothetical protein
MLGSILFLLATALAPPGSSTCSDRIREIAEADGYRLYHAFGRQSDNPMCVDLLMKRPTGELLQLKCDRFQDGTKKAQAIQGIGNGAAGARPRASLSIFKLGESSFATDGLDVLIDAFAGSYGIRVQSGRNPLESQSAEPEKTRLHAANVAEAQKVARYLLANAMGLGIDDEGRPSSRPSVPGIDEDCSGYVALAAWAAANGVAVTYDDTLALAKFTWRQRPVVLPLATDNVQVDGRDVELGRFVIARGKKWFVPERQLNEALGP